MPSCVLPRFRIPYVKTSMITDLTLPLSNFSKPFVVEIGANFVGIRVVLMQERHPISFLSKALVKKHLSLYVYDQELMIIVHAVKRW